MIVAKRPHACNNIFGIVNFPLCLLVITSHAMIGQVPTSYLHPHLQPPSGIDLRSIPATFNSLSTLIIFMFGPLYIAPCCVPFFSNP